MDWRRSISMLTMILTCSLLFLPDSGFYAVKEVVLGLNPKLELPF